MLGAIFLSDELNEQGGDWEEVEPEGHEEYPEEEVDEPAELVKTRSLSPEVDG